MIGKNTLDVHPVPAAEVKEILVEEVEKTTTENAKNIFQI